MIRLTYEDAESVAQLLSEWAEPSTRNMVFKVEESERGTFKNGCLPGSASRSRADPAHAGR